MLEVIAQNLLATGAAGREQFDVGPFRGFSWPHSDDFLMSFATPVGPAPAEWAPHVDALQRAFSGRGRRLRLEYIEQLYPTLADALEQAGLGRDKSAVAMALSRDQFHPALKMTGGAYRPVDDRNLDAFFLAHNAAFGMAEERVAAWLPLMRHGLSTGTMIAGMNVLAGRPVSGATLLIGGGTAELAGVWTARDKRGRGLAGDACSRLLYDYFETGAASAWLSTDASSGGLYARLGFSSVGTQLNFS